MLFIHAVRASKKFICLHFSLILYNSLGTFLPYDVINDPDGPQIYGVNAGIYKDGTIAYVGYGFNGRGGLNALQAKCPGRFFNQINNSLLGNIFRSF